jgi:hypothetical protein
MFFVDSVKESVVIPNQFKNINIRTDMGWGKFKIKDLYKFPPVWTIICHFEGWLISGHTKSNLSSSYCWKWVILLTKFYFRLCANRVRRIRDVSRSRICNHFVSDLESSNFYFRNISILTNIDDAVTYRSVSDSRLRSFIFAYFRHPMADVTTTAVWGKSRIVLILTSHWRAGRAQSV